MIEQFMDDVDFGLSQQQKSLPSKYFYNKEGDALFVKIMHLPEYYLTRSELEVFQTKSTELLNILKLSKENYFELIELGAGDGLKTKELLKVLIDENYSFGYLPVDISKNALDNLEKTLKNELPKVSVKQQQGDYFEVLDAIKNSEHQKIVLFLGSNIGNMNDEIAADFIYKLGKSFKPNDKLLLGVDLIKPESIVLPAYNDKEGVTADFNLNLLKRINKELEADFDLKNFSHAPEYSEETGIAKSYLQSDVAQNVTIKKLNKSFAFEAGEKIFTEISRKYNDEIIENIISKTDFEVSGKLTDDKGYFANYILTRK
ncbi:L-histidine N(alpha)-methyltransferase [Tenacibaculum sp. M341]|uniref:L-histidine N(alpha)-methyltransferase n=1 Tax=Tenacibaculum sp. M341 TaxID=2530339 RepID=UPI00104839CD|nr:L-histidine N(alpha)-methyltransferase [Tenacibaculum sp. M341]TCI92787.1 L-histidine N(alpha)-methyltransferase [Tenacibaculum sp. M341]